MKNTSQIIRQFQTAMALMSVIPLLGFVYLIGHFAGLRVFAQGAGVLAVGIFTVSLCGLLLARMLVTNVVKDLERANEDLRLASEQKTAFLRNVAHEAASPLATARGNLEAIRQELHGPVGSEIKHPVDVSLRQVERLLRMVSDLLDISKIERGVLPLKLASIDLTPVLDEAVESSGEGLVDAPHVRVLSPAAARRMEEGDRDRIVQVLVNLIRNAQKYGPPAGEITVECRDAGAAYEFRVADRGDGVPDALKEKVFEAFTRGTTRDVPGVGLGLAISKHIVSLHGGRIWIEDNPGGGSVFVFQLPKKPKPERPR